MTHMLSGCKPIELFTMNSAEKFVKIFYIRTKGRSG
jgi:hypothetical protein